MNRELSHELADVLTVTYGDNRDLQRLLRSLEVQTQKIGRLWVWHNGPLPFDKSLVAPARLRVEVLQIGDNLGYGAGINRIWSKSQSSIAVVVNPDVELHRDCIAQLVAGFHGDEPTVIVGGLLEGRDGKVNASGLSLTFDGVGIDVHRGQRVDQVQPFDGGTVANPLAPSGALFAVRRNSWASIGGGSKLFPESLFLYCEDLALGLRVRQLSGRIEFCTLPLGIHDFSASTGRRSELKLYHVERNRLWLQRVLGGRVRALSRMPFTGLRLGAYWCAQKIKRAEAPGGDGAKLSRALLRGWRDGLFADVPEELRGYLSGGSAIDLRPFIAPLSAQLKDPTA